MIIQRFNTSDELILKKRRRETQQQQTLYRRTVWSVKWCQIESCLFRHFHHIHLFFHFQALKQTNSTAKLLPFPNLKYSMLKENFCSKNKV
jgi:hypothetical protein